MNFIEFGVSASAAGPELDTGVWEFTTRETAVTPMRSVATAAEQKRSSERRAITMPARLTWKDQRGTTRFASVIAKNVSDQGLYVESLSPLSLSLYRLVQVQFEREGRDAIGLPTAIRDGRTLSAVYRITPPNSGGRQGFALRLMVDPKRHVATEVAATRATA
jgi:hypothetical protein